MRQKDRYFHILNSFRDNMPLAQTELNYENPYQLLVAVILSAQCTDKRVNLTTPLLFEHFPNPETLSKASFDEVFNLIKSISYPNNKSRHLIGMASRLVSEYNGEVPPDIDELMTLPGVGRKTANVIASVIYDKPVIAVDTHVFRVSHRLGLSREKTPAAVEKELEKNIPEEMRAISHHWLILHGRYVCTAKNPHCNECYLSEWCEHFVMSNLRPEGVKQAKI